MSDQSYLSVREVMDITDLSRNTIYKFIRLGKLKAHPIGERGWRIKRADLTAWIEGGDQGGNL